MSLSAIPKSLRAEIFKRDRGSCRYCRLSQVGQGAVFHVNHVIPRSKNGATDVGNLVLQCPYCSLHKSDKTAAADPMTGMQVNLFHPLQQKWDEQFELSASGQVQGKSAIGRATVEALHMNDPLPRVARRLQLLLGLLPFEDVSK